MKANLIKIVTFMLLLKNIKAKTQIYADYPDSTSQSDSSDPNDNNYIRNQQSNNKGQSVTNRGQSVTYGGQSITYGGQSVTYGGQSVTYKGQSAIYKDLSEHTMVTNSNVFPYMATILKGTKYMSAGALVDPNWVITTADGLFMMRESIRFLRIRLGSINYKKGGILLPVKMLEIHPYFDDSRPNYDLALIMLAKPVRFTPNLKAIRLQMTPRELTATHFIVTSWLGPLESKSKNLTSELQSMEMIKRHRIMTVTHLHPSNPQKCDEELQEIGTSTDAIMCLDPGGMNPCLRDVGAPVVLNNVLRAVVSSWKAEDCDENSDGPIFAILVSAKNVSSWIHATVHGHRWVP